MSAMATQGCIRWSSRAVASHAVRLTSLRSTRATSMGVRACSTAAGDGAADSLRVAIVGTGPAGFYSAKYLLKDAPGCTVDLIDRMPVPYGLVRFGVAPDHPEVKSVMNDFAAVAADAGDRLNFLGGVDVGSDIDIAELRKHYNAVILANGAQGDTSLGIQGEDLGNVFSARAFVNWYNGHPDFVDLNPNLDVEHVVVVGNGNVAIDCARVLAKSVEELSTTDIADHALEALAKSKVRRVSVVGRRGHVQAAFTMKELRELTRLESARFVVDEAELDAGFTEASQEEIKQHRAKKRMNELLRKNCAAGAIAGLDDSLEADGRQLVLRFLRSPIEIKPADGDSNQAGYVVLEANQLSGEANKQRATRIEGETETVPAGMVLESIGYKSLPMEGVPFNPDWNIINNMNGVVVDYDGEAGLFCTGWVKRGPSGIIGTNIPDARETVAAVLRDAKAGALPDVQVEGGIDAVRAALESSGAKQASDTVDWQGYLRIEAEERKRGEVDGRPFNKIVAVDEMLAVAKGSQ